MNTGIRLAVAAVMAGILAVGPRPGAAAQSAALQGVVLEQSSDRPLVGVTLTMVESPLVLKTDASGQFSFVDVTPGPVTVRASLDGYVTVAERLEVVAGEELFVQLRLPALSAALDELMIRGDRESLASDLSPGTDEDGYATAADLLVSRFPSVNLRRNMGSAGGGARVQLRGVNSMTLSNEAAIYVDGVRISPRMGSFGLRSSEEVHTLETIPASSVQRIRILRGPAATARYPDTSNGVILIETVQDGAVPGLSTR